MRRVSESGMHEFKLLTAAKVVLGPNSMPHSNSCGYGVARIPRADGYGQRSEIDYRELNQDS